MQNYTKQYEIKGHSFIRLKRIEEARIACATFQAEAHVNLGLAIHPLKLLPWSKDQFVLSRFTEYYCIVATVAYNELHATLNLDNYGR